MVFIFLSVTTLFSCKKIVQSTTSPIIQAHKIADVQGDTHTEVNHIHDQGYPSIEIDVSITSDQILVIHHDYWINNKYCTTLNKRSSSKKQLLKNITFQDLQNQIQCIDPISNQRKVISSVEELLSSPFLHPETFINLDIKYHPQFTRSHIEFSDAIIKITHKFQDRHMIITTSHPNLVERIKDQSNIPVFLEYPFFASSSHRIQNIFVALYAWLNHSLGRKRFSDVIKKTRADGISLPFQIIGLKDVLLLNKKGIAVQLWTVNRPNDLARLCTWPIDFLISDTPQVAPCFTRLTNTSFHTQEHHK